ncbi:MAG: S9 family peptidase [Acidobacteria bacterium]|nr:S9 family peptidase [Acidobacteriota bacterium]
MIPRLVLCAILLPALLDAQTGRLQSSDLHKLKSVRDAQISPDGVRIAYTISDSSTDRNPQSHIEIMTLATNQSAAIGGRRSSQPLWSPDGKLLAFSGELDGKSGLYVARPDGSGAKLLHALGSTNSPLPNAGKPFSWSPDSRQLVFVHATPGPETADASGDPVVITRYLYKPELSEGNTRFNDNKRLHLYITDVASGATRQLTKGDLYEHSPDWSPDGKEILFISNREPDGDQFFNYDILAVRASDGSIRRITATESAEYRPQWSPDGKKIAFLGTRRGLTDLETTMEDTHVWVMNSDGSGRTEIGKKIDNRQGPPQWTPDGDALMCTAQRRGSVWLYRLPVNGGEPVAVHNLAGQFGQFSLSKGKMAFAYSPPSDQAELFVMEGSNTRQLTRLNDAVLKSVAVAKVEPLTFVSNDFKWEVEAFLTHPVGRTETSRHPMIVMLHGGPHGQQGPAFNFKAQVYAARGWAVLMVNYRGSTGYGQAFADAVFGDQNGNEAQDVLYAVSAAVRRNPWIDRDRLGVEGGSYGGQLSAWLVTQTHIFKAAIPLAPIINLVSYNYMTYYNMYEQMTFGIQPHQGDLMDTLWKRSSLRYVAQVKTPVMLLHGENDNDVCIAESEQFYIGLKDAGVETVMVRYPREGHGLRESRHIIDSIDRSIQWYEKHFPRK